MKIFQQKYMMIKIRLAKNIFLSTGQALSHAKNDSSDMMEESEERAHSGSF